MTTSTLHTMDPNFSNLNFPSRPWFWRRPPMQRNQQPLPFAIPFVVQPLLVLDPTMMPWYEGSEGSAPAYQEMGQQQVYRAPSWGPTRNQGSRGCQTAAPHYNTLHESSRTIA